MCIYCALRIGARLDKMKKQKPFFFPPKKPCSAKQGKRERENIFKKQDTNKLHSLFFSFHLSANTHTPSKIWKNTSKEEDKQEERRE